MPTSSWPFWPTASWVTLQKRLQAHAPGLTARSALQKLCTTQLLDGWIPTTDGRYLVMPRYTQPEMEQANLIKSSDCAFRPNVHRASTCRARLRINRKCSEDLWHASSETKDLGLAYGPICESRAKDVLETLNLEALLQSLAGYACAEILASLADRGRGEAMSGGTRAN